MHTYLEVSIKLGCLVMLSNQNAKVEAIIFIQTLDSIGFHHAQNLRVTNPSLYNILTIKVPPKLNPHVQLHIQHFNKCISARSNLIICPCMTHTKLQELSYSNLCTITCKINKHMIHTWDVMRLGFFMLVKKLGKKWGHVVHMGVNLPDEVVLSCGPLHYRIELLF
jgi:hypothetical protein